MKLAPRFLADRFAPTRATTPIQKITVVTVCLNVRDSIRLTLDSVAHQHFPLMEHVIIDGGSTDGTCEIVREYEPAWFVSEKDEGVYDAMDKGRKAATGDIVIFLNAGDTFYDADVCSEVAAFFDEARADIVFGNLMPVYLDEGGTHDHGAFVAGELLDLGYLVNRGQLYDESIHHQATFYRRWVLEQCSYACEKPEATGEYNLLLNAVMKHGARVKHLALPVSRFVLGGISTRNFDQEWARYVEARDSLRALYFPGGARPEVRDATEFFQARRARPAESRLARRIRTKETLKQSVAFKGYDRLMLSLSERTVNRLMERLDPRLSADALSTRSAQAELSRQIAKSRADAKASRKALARRIEALEAKMVEMGRAHGRDLASLSARVGTPEDRQHQLEQTVNPPLERLQHGLARVAALVNVSEAFADHGYRVSSQWDEDGLIQYLISRAPISDHRFVEIGVGDYSESNTRFLLQKDNWSGLIVDSSSESMNRVRNSPIYWRHSLTAVASFVTAENVNDLLTGHGMTGEIGLLSIDIDGVDYWIWKAISVIQPRIVVCEYNGLFGPTAAVTVPYDAAFDRAEKHYSWLYAGASLAALASLGRAKGYTLVGTSTGGNNAFFVRDDILAASRIQPMAVPFTRPRFRESRNPDGSLSYLDIDEGARLIGHLEVWDTDEGEMVTVAEALGHY